MPMKRFTNITQLSTLLTLIVSLGPVGAHPQTDDSTSQTTLVDSLTAPPASSSSTPAYTLDAIDVTADKITVREIIRRAVEGERKKLAGHDNMTYTMTLRTIVTWKKRRTIQDKVFRSYADIRGNSRAILLDEWVGKYKRNGDQWVVDKDDTKDDESPIQATTRGQDDFAQVPFFLEDEHEYDFTLVDRKLEVDHVIFEIAFRPKSDFKGLPSGTVYVDTKNYQIIHEVFEFDHNPMPLFIKGIRRISRHWAKLPGGEWVFTKIMFEVEPRTDPFGYVPGRVAIALTREDFRFDEGYDARLLGNTQARVAPLSTASNTAPIEKPHGSVDSNAEPAGGSPDAIGSGDTPTGQSRDVLESRDEPAGSERLVTPEPTPGGTLLETLQQADNIFFTRELQAVNGAFRDRVLAQHDSLGLDAFFKMVHRRGHLLQTRFGAATRLFDYNHVEGLVIGARAGLRLRGETRPSLNVEAAFATGSGKFRHDELLSVPWRRGATRTMLTLRYFDRVLAYGSNQPALNPIRSLAAADDRDYLRREGGAAGLSWNHTLGVGLGLTYEVTREHSIGATSVFSVFDDLETFNAPIDEGIDRSATARVSWGEHSDRRLRLNVLQRLAGGALGGDFEYARTDAALEWRHFVIGRHEVQTTLAAAVTGGSPPLQRMPDVGGLSTVRGYERRARVGERSLNGRLEYLLPYDVLARTPLPILRASRLQLVGWADAGRVWEGNADSWLYSVGIGIQRYLGPFGNASNLRLDISFPLGVDPPDDIRLDLQFARALF